MRTKKALYNMAASLVLQLATASIGFIVPRLVISSYGSAVNGMVSSINQFLVYLNLVEGGIASASIAALYVPLADNDNIRINRILSAARRFYNNSGCIFAALVLALSFLYPLIVDNQVSGMLSFAMVLLLGFSGVVEFFFIGKYRVLLTADQKIYILTNIQTAAVVLNAIIKVALILNGFGILFVQTFAAAVYLLRAVLIYRYIKKNYPFISFKAQPDMKAIDKRWDALIHQITGLIVLNTDIIVVTIFCGLKEVSVYTVYNMVFASLGMIVASFSSSLSAGFGNVLAAKDTRLLKETYYSFEYIYYAVLAWAYSCAFVLIMPFVSIYTAGITDADYIRPAVAAAFILVGVANQIRIPQGILVVAAGHFKETKYKAILEAGINITASLILVNIFGMVGVLMGTVCSYAYRTLDFIFYTPRKILHTSVKPTFARLFRNICLSIVSIVPFIVLLKVKAGSYLQWLLWAAVVGLWSFIIVFGINYMLEPNSMKSILVRIKAMTKRT
jgi:O-antigen/teichoic acid export membrane protein